MHVPRRSTLPHWLADMRGAHSAAELAVVDFFPLDFEAYCRVLNPARSGFGGAMPWTKLAGPSTSVSAATQWADISSQPGLRDQPRMDPVMGGFDSETAAALAPVLLRHTQTPRRVYYLAWEGYADINDDYRASETVRASYGRNMHVLEGTVQEASSPMVKGLSGAPLWWIPADGAWCVGNDIYARSVYVGGAPSCIQEILADQELEAYPVSAWQRVVTEDY